MPALSRSILATAATCASALALSVLPAAAQVPEGLGGVRYDSFHADVELRDDGSFDVSERIEGSFSEPRHGIFRYLPALYALPDGSSHDIRVSVQAARRDGERVPFTVAREGADVVIRLGDPEAAFEGDFRYELYYRVEDAVLFHDLEDEVYWNVTGDKWDAPIAAASAKVKLPGVRLDQIEADCHQGGAGSTLSCPVSVAHEEVSVQGKAPLTVSVRFPKNFTHEPSTAKRALWWLEGHWDFFFPLIPLFALFVLLHRWRHHGRDPRRKGPVVAQYEPPQGLRPAQLGTLVDARVDGRDFSSTLVDLAVRGFLSVERAKDDYLLRRAKADGDLEPYEREILDALFAQGGEARLSRSGEALARARSKAQKALYGQMADLGYYVKNPSAARAIHAAIGIVVAWVAFVLGGQVAEMTGRPIAMASLFATAGFFLLFAPFMPKKTEKGAVAADLGNGFREFLSGADVERASAHLPYAVAFGIRGGWEETFASAFGGDLDAFVSALEAAAGQD